MESLLGPKGCVHNEPEMFYKYTHYKMVKENVNHIKYLLCNYQ